jgi:hypothetical protein
MFYVKNTVCAFRSIKKAAGVTDDFFLCAGHGLMLVGLKSPAGRDGWNRKPMATAAWRRVVGRKPEANVGLNEQEPDIRPVSSG